MKKSYRIFVALVLMVLCAMDASAGLKRVPLTADMFFAWDGWGADAQKQSDTPVTCAFELGTPSDLAYGDGSVINYADLSDYVSLEITFSAGTPRVLLNRDIDGGQWNADEANSHLIEYPKGDDVWSAKYFKLDGNVLSPSGAAVPQVHHHIEHRAPRDAHQLCLAPLAALEMQSSQHALGRERLVVLHKVDMSNMGIKISLLKNLAEIATAIPKPLGLYNPDAFDILLDEIHDLFYLMKQWAKLTIFKNSDKIIQ